jgi:hypothetical protein
MIDNKSHASRSEARDKDKFDRGKLRRIFSRRQSLTLFLDLLDRLKPIVTAFHDHPEAASPCCEDTRVDLLESISSWMLDPSSESIYWLRGVAGTGKTAVAQSVAQIATELEFINASFFFSSTTDDRRGYANVISTLAYQLGKSTRLRPAICSAIEHDNDIGVRPMRTQAARLLQDVLTGLPSDLPPCLLLVLDALDECKEGDNKMHGGELIPLLLALLENLPFVKIFVTSRPELSIERLFTHRPALGHTCSLVLHDIPKDTVQRDIELYLRDEFAKINQVTTVEPGFPSESDIRTLVQRADGLFIYARTVVEFVKDGVPEDRLAAWLESDPDSTSEQYERLDGMYSYILKKGLRFAPGKKHVFDSSLKLVLVALVLLQRNMPSTCLALLADVNHRKCAEFLRRISAVLNYQHERSEPVRLFHISFAEFLSDPTRCIELPEYRVDLESGHLALTERCLEVIGHFLHREAPLDDHLSTALHYSCRFWIAHWFEHIHAEGPRSRLPVGLNRFCAEDIEHWIGAVSTMHYRDINEVEDIMSQVLKVSRLFSTTSFLLCTRADLEERL